MQSDSKQLITGGFGLNMLKAAREGNLEYIIKNIKIYKNNTGNDWWSVDIASTAIQYNHIHIINWIIQNNLSINEYAFHAAARYSRLEILEKLKNYKPIWNWSTLMDGIRSGETSTVEWLLDNGCPYNGEYLLRHLNECRDIVLHEYLVNRLFRGNNIATENLFTRKMCAKAVVDRNLGLLNFEMEEYMKRFGHPYWDNSLFRMAIYNSSADMDIAKWLLSKNYNLYGEDFDFAAELGQTGLIELMKSQMETQKQMCLWSTNTVKKAALNKQYSTFKYLLENGCPYDIMEITQLGQKDEKLRNIILEICL